MTKIFIDTDIIIDLFAKREPFYEDSAKLFTNIDSGLIKGYISPIIIANLHYILTKLKNKTQAEKNIQKLLNLVNILSVDEKIINLALSSNFKDFEDSIQYYTAVEHKIKYLITRNIKDYRNAEISILTAEEFNNIINKLEK